MTRPAPREAPEGYRCEVYPAGSGWRLVSGKRCRAGGGYRSKACGAPSIAELRRPTYRTHDGRWWAYCAEHMYGRWVEGGQILEWRLVPELHCSECCDDNEDPLPWCDCRAGEACDGPCRQRAHSPSNCPATPMRAAVQP